MYDALISAATFGKKEAFVITGGINGYIGGSVEDCEDQYGGYGFGLENKKVKRFYSFKYPRTGQ